MQIIQQTARMKRTMRKPSVSFSLKQKPYQMQPAYIHPVLPGESMKNALVAYRAVSDPLKDKLMGWWSEHYVFYVKHTDLDISQDMIEMHMDPTKDMSSLHDAADPKTFHAGGGINFTARCLDVIREWYFRDEDEVDPALLDGMHPCKINHDGWWESAKLESSMPVRDDILAGQDPTIPYDAPDGYEVHFEQYQRMVALGATDATFEDYLRTFGVRLKADDQNDEQKQRPELLRMERKWSYPTNTVEPTTGIPSSAAVWSENVSLDKTRYFKEPGFIIGVQIFRPKIHYEKIIGSLTGFMTSHDNWMPKILDLMPMTALKEFASGAGPAPELYAEDYWIDVRDLFTYGEQFRNHDLTDMGNGLALPDTSLNVDYATQAMVDAMFTGDATNRYFRTDGVVKFDIAGQVGKDQT